MSPTQTPFLARLNTWALALFALIHPTHAQPPAPGPLPVRAGGREFPIGSLQQPDQLPASRLRAQVEGLPPIAREQAVRWLSSFHFTEHDLPSLHADASGAILYACNLSSPTSLAPASLPEVGAAALPVSPFPTSLVFHSKPGAANILYLNFCGETVANTQWNLELNRTVIPAVPFSADADPATFSDAEQVSIKRIWERMAEDYAPFNLDVTTERPAAFTTRTAMALITRTTDANGDLNPYSTAGGVSYVNVFGTTTYATYRPAWIYHNNLASDESFIAEAASHEIGHNLGLSHDGRTDGTEYYGGHGTGDISWGPLMGTGYYRDVSHWSKGEYALASNTQDDLATIASKLTYRTDDHGGTPGTATALLISGGTNVFSTTPENDPTNLNPANKGVLERSTDVDVFSFVTGDGPVSLAASPWVMPAGTRGGNADILVQLYDEAGTLLLTNNPAALTSALLQTNLPQGRYYLHVKATAAGDPWSSTPTGYTVYGSLGQYFLSGSITAPTAYTVPPLAEASVSDVVGASQSTASFSVRYSDDVAVAVSTLDSNDIRVTGPNGYNQLARLVAVDSADDGTPRTATYTIPPPGAVWLPADNGTYTLWMQTDQVRDTEGAFVAAGSLGQFQVAVPIALYAATMDVDPGWTLEPEWEYGAPTYPSGGPTAGFTGSKIIAYNAAGDYASRLTARYATTPVIDCTGTTSLNLRFKRWLRVRANDPVSIQVSTNGSSWLDVWSSSSAISDTAWQEVQYALPAAAAGSPTVRLRWSLASNQMQTDIGWNLDDVEVLANGTLDTTPPTAVLHAANLTLAGSPSHSCSVTYSDATAVHLDTLDATDLIVAGPNGYSTSVEFVGADLPADGSPITATYSIPAPGGTWDPADNGDYTITLQEAAAGDTLNNFTPQTTLGTFTVALSTVETASLQVLPSSGLVSTGTVGGPFTPSAVSYTLTNSGGSTVSWTATRTAEWVDLSANSGTLAPGTYTTVTVSIGPGATTLPAGTYADAVTFLDVTHNTAASSPEVRLVIQDAAAALALPPVWRWSNPLPHGATIVDQTTVGPLSAQVGERGQVFTSDDWGLWWPRDTHTTAAMRGATFFGGRLVVSGEAGTILFADRPDQFYLLDLQTTDWLEGVAASSDRVVAVGDHAAVYTSTNAVVWQRVAGLTFTNWLRSVAYGGNQFVAVGEQGLIATSINGSTWQVRTSGTTTNLNRATWVGDHFLVAGDGGILLTNSGSGSWLKVASGTTNPLYGATGTPTSQVVDGSLEARLSENAGTWVDQCSPTLPFPAPQWTYYTALANSDYYLLSGRTGMNVEGTRTNGAVTWKPAADSIRTWLWSVARTPSHYVAVGDYGTILSSPNGIDWDLELVPASATNSILLGVGGSSNLLLAVGSQGTILWGTNTFAWHALTAPTVNDLQGVCFDGQQFVLTGGDGTVLTSPDGTNWTQRSTPTTRFLMSVATYPGGLVAVGDDGAILTSTDHGTNWTQRNSGTTNWLSQVRWLNDRLLAVGENGTIVSSTDGTRWQTLASGTTAWLNAAEHAEGVWFVAGNQGTVLASPDSTNWFSLGTVTKRSLYGASIHEGQLVLVGTEGVIVRSQLVPNPSPVSIAGFSRSSGMNVFLFTGAPDQRFVLESSPDLAQWNEDVQLEILDGSGTLLWTSESGVEAPAAGFYRTRLVP